MEYQPMLKEEIKELSRKLHQEIIDIRRHLHKHPELSFCEFETTKFVKSYLDKLSIPWKPVGNTGLAAIIKGSQPSIKTIALRADMDALPINENNNVEYKSSNEGVMHACGHDVHTSSLLGTASILQDLRNRFGGTIKLIFQPAEEKLPGGAIGMIRDGILKDPAPLAVIGQHVMPSLSAGKIALRAGRHMASMDELFVTVHGKGGHGAQPHLNTDPVLITAHIIVALQQVVSRMANPYIPTVLSFGKQIANGAINVIPDDVYMEGTFRTMDEQWRDEAHKLMKKMAANIAESMGGKCDFSIVRGYPFLVNEKKLTEQVQQYACEYIGMENVEEAEIWMAAEDFAYYSHSIDSCFYLLGVGNKSKGISSSLHTPTFNIDEDCLELSAGLMAYLAIQILSK